MKSILLSVAAALIVLAACPLAEAQSRIGAPRRNPTVSPYLNLLRNRSTGGGIGFNYYLRTRPQQRAIRAQRELSRSLNQIERRQSALQREIESGLAPTGHRTSFLDLGGYYPNFQR